MKALVIAMVSLVAFNASAAEVYCRTVSTGGMFGQPAGQGQHCVSLDNGKLTDNANTFFGNPPETLPYKISQYNGAVYVLRSGSWEQVYTLTARGLENKAGAILARVK